MACDDNNTRDPATGLYNRRRLFEALEAELAHATRREGRLSLIVVAIDHFESINDVHGGPIGDELLRTTAKRILDGIRREDIPGRCGGVRLAIICRGAGAQEAAVLAERLRAEIERGPLLVQRPDLRVTISAGVAEGPQKTSTDPGRLVAEADEALREATRAGRNVVRLAGSVVDP